MMSFRKPAHRPVGLVRSFSWKLFLLSSFGSVAFAHQSPPDPYLEIASYYAPVVYQDVAHELWDYITRFDFDGNWIGADNWQHATKDADYRAYVYYAVAESDNFLWITYTFFHPVDYKWSSSVKLLVHENDMEGVIAVVDKNSKSMQHKFGRLVALETLAHNRFRAYANRGEDLVQSRRLPLQKDPIEYEPSSPNRPLILIESNKGHGVHADRFRRTQSVEELERAAKDFAAEAPPDEIRRLAKTAADRPIIRLSIPRKEDGSVKFPGGNGIKYVLGAQAEDPSDETGTERVCRYELLDISTSLWARRERHQGDDATYARPTTFWNGRDRTSSTYGAAFDGGGRPSWFIRDQARPPWGWKMPDDRLERGDWFLDPMRAFWIHLKIDGLDTTERYIHNPFLEEPNFQGAWGEFEQRAWGLP